jgi:hypothetical protein
MGRPDGASKDAAGDCRKDLRLSSTRRQDGGRRREIQSGRRHAVGDTPEHFAKYLREDIGRWRAVVDKAGIKIE